MGEITYFCVKVLLQLKWQDVCHVFQGKVIIVVRAERLEENI